MSGPIEPKALLKGKEFPEEVFEVFNALILEKWDGNCSVILQEEAAKRIAKALKIPFPQVFERRLLDVEPAYRARGWRVEYDKPGYCETYSAFFTFKPSEKARSDNT